VLLSQRIDEKSGMGQYCILCIHVDGDKKIHLSIRVGSSTKPKVVQLPKHKRSTSGHQIKEVWKALTHWRLQREKHVRIWRKEGWLVGHATM
jgi:predicted RNA-binding protein with RPS1 domain